MTQPRLPLPDQEGPGPICCEPASALRNKTVALLVLASLGLLVTALSVVLHRPGSGPVEPPAAAPWQLDARNPTGLEDAETTREVALGGPGEPIAERSQDRRVRLQFRCETLGHNTKAVWRHMKLTLRIEDQEGQYLGESTEPWLPITLSIPAEVEHIALIAKGYKREVVPTPRTHRGDTKAVVFLEPDALVRVRARNLPSRAGNRYAISARLATGTDAEGRPLLHGFAHRSRPGAEARRGEVAVHIKVPSGVGSMFLVSRTTRSADERTGFIHLASPMVTLRSGETRDVIIDLMDFGVLQGRVTGVPGAALKDQVLSLGTETVGSPIVLDEQGHFRVLGLPPWPVTLQLRTQAGPWPRLQEVPGGRRQWRAADVGFVVLEPETPVHGVVPVQGGRHLERPFQVQANSPPYAGNLTHRIPLFTRQLLDRVPLFFFVPGIGHFSRSLAGQLPDAEGIYQVEVPVPGGSLLVRVLDPPSQGIHLFARPVALARTRPWINVTGVQTGDEWRFEGLAAGEYELVINYSTRRGKQPIHSERSLPETVRVESRQETELTVRMPELIEIHGQVENWRDIPTMLRPSSLQLHHGGRPHSARLGADGSFKLTVLGPWDGICEVTFFNPYLMTTVKTTDITWLPAKHRFSVVFPSGIRERWLTAAPIAGGRMSIHAHLGDASGAAHSPWGHDRGQQLPPQQGNRFLVADAPGGVDGILLEQVQDLRILRGWFRLHAGGPEEVELAPKGRWVQVAVSRSGVSATLTLNPPAWWKHPPYKGAELHLQGTEPQRLWIPDQATAVVVNGTGQIPVAGIGDELIVE